MNEEDRTCRECRYYFEDDDQWACMNKKRSRYTRPYCSCGLWESFEELASAYNGRRKQMAG